MISYPSPTHWASFLVVVAFSLIHLPAIRQYLHFRFRLTPSPEVSIASQCVIWCYNHAHALLVYMYHVPCKDIIISTASRRSLYTHLGHFGDSGASRCAQHSQGQLSSHAARSMRDARPNSKEYIQESFWHESIMLSKLNQVWMRVKRWTQRKDQRMFKETPYLRRTAVQWISWLNY